MSGVLSDHIDVRYVVLGLAGVQLAYCVVWTLATRKIRAQMANQGAAPDAGEWITLLGPGLISASVAARTAPARWLAQPDPSSRSGHGSIVIA